MSTPLTISIYDVAVPTFTNGLRALAHILRQAEAFAEREGLDVDSAFAQARLVADQNPLIFQVQNATKTVRANVDRLAAGGAASEPFADTEQTFADLHARIRAALDLVRGVEPAVANARAGEVVGLSAGGKPVQLTVQQAVLGHGIPNFIFHITTAYSILRANGVPLGKADFISSFVGL
ncbi:helix-turn-helix-domain-containing protein type [Lasiosphaeria ovina]|uniref:Helix-turn-helix-domain-containing protein type n=1 Tax=Lasiosphaeria ovina TaxID=92902 RepID=A0AAE0TSV4_9PEZI|nr:helix-turn-helix-domain-containing protein type [Lasiosphaeria ovina]